MAWLIYAGWRLLDLISTKQKLTAHRRKPIDAGEASCVSPSYAWGKRAGFGLR